MKNLLFIFTLSFSVLYSCSSGDDNGDDDNTADMLIGTWQYHRIGVFDTGTIINSDVVLEFDWDHDCENQKDYLQLDENSVAIDVWFNENCVEDITTLTWTRTNDFVVFSSGTETVSREIIRLTNSELIIKFPPQNSNDPDFEVWGLIKL